MSTFCDALRSLRSGETEDLLTTQLETLCRQATMVQKVATLTLTLRITPNGAAGVRIVDKVAVREPAADHETIFFVTDEGLSRRDPRQLSLEDLNNAR